MPKSTLLLLLVATITATEQAPAAKPNVILIMVDDLGWGDVAYSQDRAIGDTYAGHPVLQTPQLTQMADAALKFDRFYAASPVCSPTRASFLTGRHGSRHGIDSALFLSSDGKIRNRDLTIAELAKTQGYATGHFGKWHVGSLTKHTYDMRRGREGNFRDYSAPWNNGYDVTFASENWMPTYDPYDAFPISNAAQAAYFTGPSDPTLANRVPNDNRINDRDESEIVATQAIEYIEQAASDSQPFFTTVWFATPHVPLEETPSTLYDNLGLSSSQRRYFEAVTRMDEQIGRIRGKVAELGLAEDTLIMFTSDNGPNNLSTGSNGGLRDDKGSLYEGGIRAPMLMEWQGRIAAGTSTPAMATTSDILPTLMDIWGAEMPDARPLDGSSMLSVLEEGNQAREEDYRFYSKFNNHRMAMDNRYKLISTNSGSSYQLYDLLTDPSETNDLLTDSPARAYREIRDSLLNGYNSWNASTQASEQGGDYSTRITESSNAVVREDVETSLGLAQIGTDSFGAPVFEDRYQIIEGNFEDSSRASVFVERQYATIDDLLVVDSDGSPGNYTDPDSLQTANLMPGQVVHSFLVHFDPTDSGSDRATQVELTFDDPIAGVIARSDRLDASDFLAFAEPVFATGDNPLVSGRGTLFGEAEDNGWVINEDGRTITVRLQAGPQQIDQLRVLTSASPLLMGDTNGDGIIDVQTDFQAIRDNFLLIGATRLQGDLTGDGITNLDDFKAWKRSYESLFGSLPADLEAVPEPSSGTSTSILFAGACLRRSRCAPGATTSML